MIKTKGAREITQRKCAELIPYENNPRENDKAVDAVAASIREFGFNVPIVIDKDDIIVAGHTRLKAAEKLGLEDVPTIKVGDLTDEEVRAFRLADNKTAELAGWDFAMLDEELQDITAIDMTAFGFEPEDDGEAVVIDDEYVEPESLPARTKSGELYELGDHRLLVGDATKKEDVAVLCDTPPDLLVTDPPYNVGLGTDANGHPERPSEAKARHRRQDQLIIQNDLMPKKEFEEFLTSAFEAVAEKLKPGAAFYIWHAGTNTREFVNAADRAGLTTKELLIWVKNVFAFGRQDYHWQHEPCLYGWKEGAAHYFIDDRKQATVIEDSRPDINKMSKAEMQALLEDIYSDKVSTTVLHEKKPSVSELHPTMKPVQLIARLIKNSSRPGETVLDTFGGSGTTLIACEQLGRRCQMMELDPHYADVIIDRWENFTGKKAKKYK